MTRLLLIAAAAVAIAGCQKNAAVAPANEGAANITSVDANAMPDDANITDIPADDGDAPSDTETNTK